MNWGCETLIRYLSGKVVIVGIVDPGANDLSGGGRPAGDINQAIDPRGLILSSSPEDKVAFL